MKTTLTFTGKDNGLVANLDHGEAAESIEFTMPEFSGDPLYVQGMRREAAAKFFAEIGERVWKQMSPGDFEEEPAAPTE